MEEYKDGRRLGGKIRAAARIQVRSCNRVEMIDKADTRETVLVLDFRPSQHP